MIKGKDKVLQWFDFNRSAPIWQIALISNPNKVILGYGNNESDSDDEKELKKSFMDPATSRAMLENAFDILEPGRYVIRLRKLITAGSKWVFEEQIDTSDYSNKLNPNAPAIAGVNLLGNKTEAEIRADERAKLELEFRIKELERLLKEQKEEKVEKVSGIEKLIPILQPHMGHIVDGLFGTKTPVAVSGFNHKDKAGNVAPDEDADQQRLEAALEGLNEKLNTRNKSLVDVLDKLNNMAATNPAMFETALNILG